MGGNTGTVVTVRGDAEGDFKLEVNVKDLPLNPVPCFYGTVREDVNVPVTVWIVRDNFGIHYTTPAMVANTINHANLVLDQFAMTLGIESINYTNRSDWYSISDVSLDHLGN